MNYYNNMMSMSNSWGSFGTGLSIFVLWSLAWKGLALWRAAKADDKYWFVGFLVIHTGGLLELVYLFFFAEDKLSLNSSPTPKKSSKRKTAKKS